MSLELKLAQNHWDTYKNDGETPIDTLLRRFYSMEINTRLFALDWLGKYFDAGLVTKEEITKSDDGKMSILTEALIRHTLCTNDSTDCQCGDLLYLFMNKIDTKDASQAMEEARRILRPVSYQRLEKIIKMFREDDDDTKKRARDEISYQQEDQDADLQDKECLTGSLTESCKKQKCN